MKGASAVTALFAALLCVGCSDRGSPAGPSSVRADSLPTNSAAGQAASQGVSVSPTPRRHGALQGDPRRFADDYATRAAPCVFGGLGNRHGDASRSVHARDTAHGELRDRDRRWDIHVHGGERRHADRRLHRRSAGGPDYLDSGARDDHGWHRSIRGSGGNFHRPPVVRSGQRHDHRFVRGDHFGAWCRKVVRQKRRRAPVASAVQVGWPQFIEWLQSQPSRVWFLLTLATPLRWHPSRGLPSRSSRFGVSSRERRMVDLTFASWNQIDDLLRRLEALRSAAGSA